MARWKKKKNFFIIIIIRKNNHSVTRTRFRASHSNTPQKRLESFGYENMKTAAGKIIKEKREKEKTELC